MKLLLLLLFVPSAVYAQTDDWKNDRAAKLMDESNFKEALPYLNDIVDKNPDNIVFRRNRAVSFFNLKRYREALSDYKTLITYVPDSEYFFQVGNIYENLDSLKKAEHYFSEAIDLDKENYLFYFKRGTLVLKQSRWEDALKDFNAALLLYPEHDNSLHNRGIALYKTGQREAACSDWCQAMSLGNPVSGSHLKKNCGAAYNQCLSRK